MAWFRSARLSTLVSIWLVAGVALIMGGGECGAPVPTVPGDLGPPTGGFDATTDGASDDTGSTDDADATDALVESTHYASVLLDAVPNAEGGSFDIFDAAGTNKLSAANAPDSPVAVSPGTYLLRQYYNSAFTFATGVVVQPGRLTVVPMGAVKVATVPNSQLASFDIYDASGTQLLSSANNPDVPVTAPPGTFVLKQYYNDAFEFAAGVTVQAGQTATVGMGAIVLQTLPSSAWGSYDIYDSTGGIMYSSANDPNVRVAAPPGTYVLKQYFNEAFTYATNVVVTSGAVAAVPMGAIRYTGPVAYDIYVGSQNVSHANTPGELITAPPGTYTLYEYFTTDHVLATNVVVTAGHVTTVP